MRTAGFLLGYYGQGFFTMSVCRWMALNSRRKAAISTAVARAPGPPALAPGAAVCFPLAQLPLGDAQFTGELRSLAAALKQRDCVALELLVKAAFGRRRLVHVGLGYYPTFAVHINEED